MIDCGPYGMQMPRSDHGDAAPDGLLRISSERHDAARIVTVSGEIDMLTAPRFQATIDALLQQPSDGIVVDLTGVTFLSSSGIAIMHAAVATADERRCHLRFVLGTSAPALRPIRILGLEDTLPIHATIDAALASLTGPTQPDGPGS